MKILDCTLRDGGYYCNWDFSSKLVNEYLVAMDAIAVDYVELGFRSLNRTGFRGASAYTTDSFIRSLEIPDSVKIGVMVNAAELISYKDGVTSACRQLFSPASQSPVSLVRIACHESDFEKVLPACKYLKDLGYYVGINLMQIADYSEQRLMEIAGLADIKIIDVLYFADSMGSLDPSLVLKIVTALKNHWNGALGIHAHDNMGHALANTLRALDEGVLWLDSTVTGMGRGPGNTKTEYLIIELDERRNKKVNKTPLLRLIREYFHPMQEKYAWGTNAYYYVAGKYGIHPTYIQKMLTDPRYEEAELLAVIDHLRTNGGKKFSTDVLDSGRQMYGGELGGSWAPVQLIRDRDVLIIGAGPGVAEHHKAIERYIREHHPFVIVLNTITSISEELIDVRAACHPFRLLADCNMYKNLPQPLVVPSLRLPKIVSEELSLVNQYDFGLAIKPGLFEFHETSAVVSSSLVLAYALALCSSGMSSQVFLAGFDGYSTNDPRTIEVDELILTYSNSVGARPVTAITPTKYNIASTSVYAI